MARAVERKDQETLDHARIALDALRVRSSAPEAREGEAVAWVSPEQFAAHTDLTRSESLTGGRYLPVRKTRAGMFTQPLYAAPSADKLRIAVEALEKADAAARRGAAMVDADYNIRADVLGAEVYTITSEALAALKAEGGK